ncbi:MAG: hydroxyacylglutathione hydrolase [Ahrensia sp.]|nr:hydroxyacylglutathione hydrolase [Ahrensia sp.]
MPFIYEQFTYGADNYGVLIHDPVFNQTAMVDAGDSDAALAALDRNGWKLTQLWITHHHADHTAGLLAVKAATGCHVYGPLEKSKPIAGIDQFLGDGHKFDFAGKDVSVIATPGHTLDMINFHIESESVLFVGDTLFVMGCGRLFEGTPAQMFDSLAKLAALPPQTTVYCSHEYSSANAEFAKFVDPKNEAIQSRAVEIAELRAANKPTVPTTIARELETNVFLRSHTDSIRRQLNMLEASDLEVFAKLRALKNSF